MRLRYVIALLSMMLSSVVLFAAQETTGRITGRIVDPQGLAVPGVSVTVSGPQGVKSVTTDSDGRFNVPFLTPGVYTVRAELQGFKTAEQKDISVSVGQTFNVALKMEVGAVAETINVVGVTTLIDIRTSTTGAVVDSAFVSTVPVGRRISDVTYMAPGVSSSGSVGRQNPSIGGGSGLDNQYIIDGVNITNQGYGALGSYSIVFGSLGNATPFDFVKEVQVKTGGYEAEFGQSTGGVVNVITKSGTNNFRGSAFGYTRPTGIEGAWKQFQSVNGTVQTLSSQVHDTGVEGGFPVIKDRLFFFGAIDPQWEVRTFQPPAGFPLFNTSGYDRKRRNVSYSAKATGQLGTSHRIDASFFGDPSHGEMGPQRISSLRVSSTSSFSQIDYGGHNQTVRYNGILGSHVLLEGAYARALNRINELPSVNDWRVTDQTVSPQRITGGIGFYEAGNRSLNNQWTIKSTNIFGDHQLKYGFAYDDVTYTQINQRTGPTFVAADGRTSATGAQITIIPDVNFGKVYRVTRGNFNSGRETLQKYANFFIQETWKASSRLTINVGARYEQEKLAGTIIKDFELKNNWAPRIGAVYDAAGDGKTKVFGNYGRFYARIPNDLAARALSADDGISRADYFDAGLTRPVPNGTATIDPRTGASITNHFVIAGVGADTIDKNAKLSYLNEFVLGIDREVMANTSFGIRYIYRNIGRVLEDIANVPMAAYDLGVPGISSVEYILTNPTSSSAIFPAAQFLGAKFDDPTHRYNAIELTLNRRLANNWSLMTSYRWSRLRGNFEGFFRDDNGQSDPGITSLYDFPTNDPSYTSIGVPQFGYEGDIRYLGQDGILPLDRPHQFKTFGNYSWNNGLSIGLGLNLVSGKPITPLAPHPNYTNGGEIPTAARGSGIQTTIDGFRTRSPFESQVDLQASYVLKMGRMRNLTLVADIFNLFNERRTLDYDNWTSLDFGAGPNPDFGKPISQTVAGPQFQTPIQVRFGARFSF